MFEHRLLIRVCLIKIWTYFIINKYIFVPLKKKNKSTNVISEFEKQFMYG